VPEGRDRGHVGAPEQSLWLHVHGHLAAVAASLVWDPAKVHDAVNGSVDDLRGELVVELVQRGEGQSVELRSGRAVAQIR